VSNRAQTQQPGPVIVVAQVEIDETGFGFLHEAAGDV
jgi:hypothetical protein